MRLFTAAWQKRECTYGTLCGISTAVTFAVFFVRFIQSLVAETIDVLFGLYRLIAFLLVESCLLDRLPVGFSPAGHLRHCNRRRSRSGRPSPQPWGPADSRNQPASPHARHVHAVRGKRRIEGWDTGTAAGLCIASHALTAQLYNKAQTCRCSIV